MQQPNGSFQVYAPTVTVGESFVATVQPPCPDAPAGWTVASESLRAEGDALMKRITAHLDAIAAASGKANSEAHCRLRRKWEKIKDAFREGIDRLTELS